MPGTAHRAADNESLGERAAIVRAMGADGERLGAATHEQHRLFLHMANELAAIWQFSGGDSKREIGAGGLRLIFSHSVLPSCASVVHGRLRSKLNGKQRA